MEKTRILLLMIISSMILAAGCTENLSVSDAYKKLNFSELYTITEEGKTVSDCIKGLNGQEVRIQGFMAEQSPVDKSFIYLVNKPYTVCPFCVIYDNTKLEVLSIYMENGSPIEFTNQPVEIVGILDVEPKTDVFNYTTQFRLYAKKVNEVKDFDYDQEVLSYFQQMNQDKIIAALQLAYVNINQSLYPEILNDDSLDNEQKHIMIKEKLNLDFISQGVQVMQRNLDHIKTIKPTSSSVKEIHNELIALFDELVILLKDIDALNNQIQNNDFNDENGEDSLIKSLHDLYDRNKTSFEKFTVWNDSIR